jgi:hypothetical protein
VILLDTDVVSEPLKPRPDAAVLRWLDAQVVETLFLPAIGLAELHFGVAALPEGRRKRELGEQLDRRVLALFEGRVLPFDAAAAAAHAQLRARARRLGQAIPIVDGYIAAIALAHGLVVATRDVAPFAAAGLPVIDPWSASA